MEGQKYLVALSHFTRFGPRRLKLLFDYFGSWQNAWQGSVSDLMRCGIRDETIEKFLEFRKNFNPDEILEKIAKNNIKIVYLEDSHYPPLLREIYDPPQLLYYKGEVHEKSFAAPISIVGTRKPSSYGKEVLQQLVKELNGQCSVISGLALGIDCLAHEAALETHTCTIAFLGSGLNNIYPRTNYNCAMRILESGGAVMSEFPPDTLAYKTNFPRRNRLIAGASLGTIVIEAAERSGTLITARYALEEGREVFAVPGSIFAKTSEGTHNLLRNGAKIVTRGEDIIETLGLAKAMSHSAHQQRLPINVEERLLLELLGSETRHANELARLAKLDITVINSRLTIMEIKGLAKHLGGMYYMRTRQPL